MAITHSTNVGRTRRRLAKLLRETIPGLEIDPEDLNSNLPVYARAEFDCASWGGYGRIGKVQVHVYSWDTMGDCLKKGIDYFKPARTSHEFEVCRKS